MNKRITKKHLMSHKDFMTKPQEKRIKQIMGKDIFEKFKANILWYDWQYYLNVIYYVAPKTTNKYIENIEDFSEGLNDLTNNYTWAEKHDINKFTKDATQYLIPYFKVINELTGTERFLYAYILRIFAKNYYMRGLSVDSGKVSKQLIYVSRLLENNKLSEYKKYMLDDWRLFEWWD